jgi:hypothetical protein
VRSVVSFLTTLVLVREFAQNAGNNMKNFQFNDTKENRLLLHKRLAPFRKLFYGKDYREPKWVIDKYGKIVAKSLTPKE